MEKCDVAIIGGGPAGATCAWQLRQQGLDVVIIDKSNFPRDKVCAGWVTPAVMASLNINLEDYAKGRTLQEIRAFRTSRIGDNDVHTQYNDIVSYGIRRREFDDYLIQRCDARLRLNDPVKEVRKTSDGWVINDSLQAKLLIGAGGHFCPIARRIGGKTETKELPVAAQEMEFELSDEQLANCVVEADTPELFFTPDLKGYGWIFRKGNFLNIGLGRQDKNKLSSHVNQFIDILKKAGRIPDDVPSKLHGHAYLLYNCAPREMVSDHVLLIGDAVGLAYPQSGEGIRPAIESALLAAETVVKANGNYSSESLISYKNAMLKRFGPRQKSGINLSWLIPNGIKRFIAGRMLSNKWCSRNIVINRWFLHLQQAPLLGPFGSLVSKQ